MNKKHILDQIKRTATENGGVPLGVDRFASATGITEAAWRGRFWARWSDAVKEAGLVPNTLRPKADEDMLLGKVADYIRELGRYPTVSEMRLRKRLDDAYPNHKVLERRWNRQELVQQLEVFCGRTDGYADVVPICRAILATTPEGLDVTPANDDDEFETGYVYLALMRVGREKRYKIGKANIVDQRTRQIAVNLPEDLELVHAISTDDAYGIEAYWHKRFAEKRRGGEWFELSADDVRVFKRRRFM